MTLFLLGRQLMKLGEEAIPSTGYRQLPTSVRVVLADVFDHPDSSITDITTRTGFPQSHVSSAVVALRDRGALVTTIDPNDRRRTLVRPSARSVTTARRLTAPTDDTLTELLASRLGPESAERVAEVTAALELLASLLHPDTPEEERSPCPPTRQPRR
jgi:DNA-binding MarR family transcriptional regulator